MMEKKIMKRVAKRGIQLFIVSFEDPFHGVTLAEYT